MKLKNALKSLPYPLEKSLRYVYSCLPAKIRFGKTFWSTYKMLQQSQYWNEEMIESYQLSELEKIIKYAYENVPYYRGVFEERGLKPSDIQGFDDLKQIPFLTKEIIRENRDRLISRIVPREKLKLITTGGSTGTPMGFYAEEKSFFEREWAFMVSQWNRVGYRFGSKSIVLRGSVVKKESKNKYWDYDPIYKNLVFSTYHLNEDIMPAIIEKIRDFKPEFIWNYPSSATILAKYMQDNSIKPFASVKALLCGSENLYPFQRKLFEKVFKCRVYSWYGHTEETVLAGECEHSSYYHIFPEYGFVELIKDNSIIKSENEFGEVVATGFNNYAFPFIRYKTMDIAKYKNYNCPCKRKYKLFDKVEGRMQDVIVTTDGRFITLTALIFAQHYNSFSRLKEMQIIQEVKGEILIKIVRSPGFTEHDRVEIAKRIYDAVGEGLKVHFTFVDNISRTAIGKARFLIQKLPVDFNREFN